MAVGALLGAVAALRYAQANVDRQDELALLDDPETPLARAESGYGLTLPTPDWVTGGEDVARWLNEQGAAGLVIGCATEAVAAS